MYGVKGLPSWVSTNLRNFKRSHICIQKTVAYAKIFCIYPNMRTKHGQLRIGGRIIRICEKCVETLFPSANIYQVPKLWDPFKLILNIYIYIFTCLSACKTWPITSVTDKSKYGYKEWGRSFRKRFLMHLFSTLNERIFSLY